MRVRPPRTPLRLGRALRERLTENRMLARERFTLRSAMTWVPTASLASNGVLSRFRGASRVFRVELEAKPCRSMVSGSLSTIG